MSARVDKLLEEFSALTVDERKELVQRLGEAPGSKDGDIRRLRGLGRDVWCAIDAKSYIDAERDSWDSSTG